MRVLVIGGTGLISTAIVDRLLEKGHDPVLFNRGVTPARYSRSVETIVGDRSDHGAFAESMAKDRFDAIIDMITYDADRARNAVEVFGDRTDHYVFCSTVCVYGGPLTRIPADEDEPHRPVSDYGRGKRDAEAVFREAHQAGKFPVTMFRPSHCYGPGAPLLDIWGYNPSLVTRIREGRAILVPGDGYGLWQPGYIGDMAKGFVGALGRAETFGNAYNLVGDEIMDWRVFHERMARAIGCEAVIVPMTTQQICAGAPADETVMLREIFQYHAAYRNDRTKRDIPDFRDLLPWEEGVRRTVAWMDKANVHAPADKQPWIDELADAARDFEQSLF
ncbi:MAG: NAD-dependent epimerase/dehydratase family protein [Candidatus Hydrogenedentes bacterium]|nr:NAD-dependent epimerase/dehydratase family protein [Candidatus Hydrogenedentota bacterium]